MKLKPLGDRLIVKAIEEEESTASGILLPDTAKEKPQRGKVLAVGDVERDALLAVIVETALPDGENLASLGLFLRGVGKKNAACGRFLLLDGLDDQTIAERLELHTEPPSVLPFVGPLAL